MEILVVTSLSVLTGILGYRFGRGDVFAVALPVAICLLQVSGRHVEGIALPPNTVTSTMSTFLLMTIVASASRAHRESSRNRYRVENNASDQA